MSERMIFCYVCGRNCEYGLYAGEKWNPPDVIDCSYSTEESTNLCIKCAIERIEGLYRATQNLLEIGKTFGLDILGQEFMEKY
ncbi:MAG: hypothetical protein E6L00_03475 [Thaumarchaeota archaeon]|nr:MAG: hypothetical protein E6L00_03475 [Nitrososphaerota archaeon]